MLRVFVVSDYSRASSWAQPRSESVRGMAQLPGWVRMEASVNLGEGLTKEKAQRNPNLTSWTSGQAEQDRASRDRY